MTKKLSNVAAITDNDITGARCSALQQNLQQNLQRDLHLSLQHPTHTRAI